MVDMLGLAVRTATAGDNALVARARTGDTAAFDQLVSTRLDRWYRLAWSIVLNDADAADAVQDAVVAAWRQLPRLRDEASFDGWTNRIVANAARMSRRHRVRLREVRIEPPTSGAADVIAGRLPMSQQAATEIDRLADADAIGRAFYRLRPDERAILSLHHVDERPVTEIAATLGIPVGTAKWRLHAARKALERAMEAEA